MSLLPRLVVCERGVELLESFADRDARRIVRPRLVEFDADRVVDRGVFLGVDTDDQRPSLSGLELYRVVVGDEILIEVLGEQVALAERPPCVGTATA